MVTRRELVRNVGLVAAAGGVGLAAGCGDGPLAAVGGPAVVGRNGEARSQVARAADDPAAADTAAGAVRAFGADLHRQLASSAGNLVCSPYSLAVALAMTRNGARGGTASEMDEVLHTAQLSRLNGGLGTLATLLEQRSGPVRRADGTAAEVALHVTNSLWGQQNFAWQTAFLDALARHYGAGLRLVDYRVDPDGARTKINAWTSEQTAGRIDPLLPDDVVDHMTRLVLVNAVYLKAPWEQPFEPQLTAVAPFRRPDGSTPSVPMMRNELIQARYGRGDGWQAAELPYAGRELAMTIVLPDGPLPALERNLDGERLTAMIRSLAPRPAVRLNLPKWTFRTEIRLKEPLIELGMPTAFTPRADFRAMTTQDELFVDAVQHQAFVAVDESGTEAAAASAVVMRVKSMLPEPVSIVVDRPFLFVIHDTATATPLFVGRVTDPSA